MSFVEMKMVQWSLAVSGVVGIYGAHALLREMLPKRVVRLYWWEENAWSSLPVWQAAPSKATASLEKFAFSPTTEKLIGPSLVSGGTRNRSHVLRYIVTTTELRVSSYVTKQCKSFPSSVINGDYWILLTVICVRQLYRYLFNRIIK